METGLTTQQETTGYIYFILNTDEDSVKIGYTQNPRNRLQTMKTYSTAPLELIAVIPGNKKDEKILHNQFFNVHIRREWFRYNDAIKHFVNIHRTEELKTFCRIQESDNELRNILTKKNMTLNDLSNETGISLRHIYRIINGQTNPTAKTLRKISEATGVSFDTILGKAS